MKREKSVKVRFIEKQLETSRRNARTINATLFDEIDGLKVEYLLGQCSGEERLQEVLTHLLENCSE
jgi:hypothetical protein